MPGLQSVAELIASIGASARIAASDLREATEETTRYAAARDSTSGMTGSNPSGSTNTKQLVAALKAVR